MRLVSSLVDLIKRIDSLFADVPVSKEESLLILYLRELNEDL